MLWSELEIQTLREDTHAPLVRAGYKRAGPSSARDWLFLGRRSIEKIEAVIRGETDFGRALEYCGIRYVRTRRCFVTVSPLGQNTLVQGTNYAELLDDAVSVASPLLAPDSEEDASPEAFHTPGVKTIAQIAEFTGLPATSQMKSLVMIADEQPVLILLRGDHQLSEAKFRAFTSASKFRQATADELRTKFGADPGSLGPVGVQGVRIVADPALSGRRNMIAGANRTDYHLRHVTPGRDFKAEFADLRMVNEDDECVNGGPLTFSKVRILSPNDPNGILEASAEQNHDVDGLTLPPAIAPFIIVITPVHPERMNAAKDVYGRLMAEGHDVLLDDRDARPGVKFKDADLIGFPYRINIGKKFAEGLVEFVVRSPKQSVDTPVAELSIPPI